MNERQLVEASDELIEAGMAHLERGHSGSGGAVDDRRMEQWVHALEAGRDIAGAAAAIARCAAEAYVIAKTLDSIVEQHAVAARASVDRLRAVAPTVNAQLERQSQRIDRLLDQAFMIDPTDCSGAVLAQRTRLLEFAEALTGQVQQTLMKLMAM